MKPAILLLAALCLASCKPSQVYGPESRQEELLGGEAEVVSTETDATGAFPSGNWEDGLGNAWSAAVTGDSIVSTGASESLSGLTMSGAIDGDMFAYTIGYPEEAPLANGAARLIDSDHAYFRTVNVDGSLNAHGLLHFNHSAQVPVVQPGNPQAVSDCANPTLQGD